ncbi:alpha-hydroxy-acid oxidizing protein [Streptomyces thinghirensis]|nr:alpha-hydroxy-acid oxidizing protein [Streptomyces thinghirensis]
MHPEAEPAAARAAAASGRAVSSCPRRRARPWSRSPRRWATPSAGSSCTGRRTARRPAVSWTGQKAAGYSALFVTLDTPLLSWRPRRSRPGLPAAPASGWAPPTTSRPRRSGQAVKPVHEDSNAAVMHLPSGMFSDPAKSWPDLAFLRENWDGPIVLGGVLHPDDATRLAADAGMDGVVVSNHGGRQVAGSPSRRPMPCRAWWRRSATACRVLFDSGVRTGDDRRLQGAGARRASGAPRPPLRLGPGPRRTGGRQST